MGVDFNEKSYHVVLYVFVVLLKSALVLCLYLCLPITGQLNICVTI